MQALQGGLQREQAAHFEPEFEGNKCNTQIVQQKISYQIFFLTLFYSSEGSPAHAVFRPHYL
jgi:hypothetical protein